MTYVTYESNDDERIYERDGENVEKIRAAYPEGATVILLRWGLGDEAYYESIPRGTRGRVKMVDDYGTVFVDWEGRSLGVLVRGDDRIEVVKMPAVVCRICDGVGDLEKVVYRFVGETIFGDPHWVCGACRGADDVEWLAERPASSA